jgi:transposase
VLDKTRHHKKTVLTDEKLEDIWAWLEIRPLKSLRRLSQETGVSIGSASKATKLIKFRPYRVRVLHDLKPADAPQRIWFCNWMQKNVHNGLVDPQLLFITNEAYFHLSNYINSQNRRIWSDENPHAVHHCYSQIKSLSHWYSHHQKNLNV